MLANELYRHTRTQLAQAGIEDAAFEAELLLHHFTGYHRFDRTEVPPQTQQALAQAVQSRCHHEPLQYVLGSWPFLGLQLQVGPGVLIPRPETEEVCLYGIAMLQGMATPTVLDLCTGSGALALGVQAAIPHAAVTAVDISSNALYYCKKNIAAFAQHHSKAPRLVHANALHFQSHIADASLNLIISNPPYVTEAEYTQVAPELYFEPRMALVAPDNGLAFYKAIAANYFNKLCIGGALVFEIGAAQAEPVLKILQENGYKDCRVQNDINGQPRIAAALR